MARIIYSGLVTEIRGSIGGTTFQSNKHGYSVKNKSNSVKPASSLQESSKSRFAMAVTAWSAGDDLMRSRWNLWAANYPQYARFNSSSQLSGFEIFVKWHVFSFRLSTSINTNPTGILLISPTFNPVVTLAGSLLTLTFNASNASHDLVVNISAWPNVRGSQNFVGTKPRYIGVAYSDDVDTPYLNNMYNAFGYSPQVGDILYLKLQCWSINGAQVCSPSVYKLVIT